jgi:hypothetical protein
VELVHSLGFDTRSTVSPSDGAENSCAQIYTSSGSGWGGVSIWRVEQIRPYV